MNPCDHEHMRQRLFACEEGELPEAERREVMDHLESCPDCRAAARRWTTLAGAFFRTPAPPSEHFVRRVMARIEAERRSLSIWEGAWRWLVPALGVGVAALALVVTTPRGESPLSTEALLLAGSTGSGAFEQLMGRETPDAEEVLNLALERP